MSLGVHEEPVFAPVQAIAWVRAAPYPFAGLLRSGGSSPSAVARSMR
jgi:hypothetical protein